MSSPVETFRHIKRMKDGRFEHEIAVIMPGQYYVSSDPSIVYTVLGSCISICIRDPSLGIGGMNHFMLPAPKYVDNHDGWGESARYGSYAMELLMNEILKRGGEKKRFEVKVFGGARMFTGGKDVGLNNSTWVMDFLCNERLKPVVTDIGDTHPRKVYYYTETGRVLMKRIMRMKNKTVLDREEEYEKRLDKEMHDQELHKKDVTLF